MGRYREGLVGVVAEESGEHVGDGGAEVGGGRRAPIHAERPLLGSEHPPEPPLQLLIRIRLLPHLSAFWEKAVPVGENLLAAAGASRY